MNFHRKNNLRLSKITIIILLPFVSFAGNAAELCENFTSYEVIKKFHEEYNSTIAASFKNSYFGREGYVQPLESPDTESLSLELPDLNVREGEEQNFRARSQIVIYKDAPGNYVEGTTLYNFPSKIFQMSPDVTENGSWFSIFELWLGRNWIYPRKSFRITVYLKFISDVPSIKSNNTQSKISLILVGQQFNGHSNKWLTPSWSFDTKTFQIGSGDILKIIYSVNRNKDTNDSLGNFLFIRQNLTETNQDETIIAFKLPSIASSVQGEIGTSDYYIDGIVPAKFYTNRKGWLNLLSSYKPSTPSINILKFSANFCNKSIDAHE